MAEYETVSLDQLVESGLAPPITVGDFRSMIDAGLHHWVHQAFENTPTLKPTYSDRHEMVQKYRQSEPVHLAEIVHLILALADVYVHHVNTEYPWQRQGSTMTRVGEDVCGGFKATTWDLRIF